MLARLDEAQEEKVFFLKKHQNRPSRTMTRDLQKAQAMSETGIRNNEIAMETHYFTLMDTAPVGCVGLSLDCFEPELHGS